jgi:hypothetical protein
MKKLPFAILMALCSCGGSEKQPEVVQRDLAGEVVFEDVFLGVPTQILFYGDLMLLRDEYDGKAVSVIDMKTSTLTGRHISIGRGPGEMVAPFRLYLHGDRLHAHQMNTGRVSVYSLPGMGYVESFDMEGSPSSSMRMADHFVGEGASSRQGRLQIFDAEGTYRFAGNDWPDSDDNMATAFGLVAYQGLYCVEPAGNRYAFASRYSDKIEFHAIRRGEHVMLAESGDENVMTDFDDTGNARLAPKVFLGSAGMWGGERHCYIHWIGKNRGDEGVSRDFSDTVRRYDWDGTQTAAFKLDRQIVGMAVDETSGHIYGFIIDDEGYIRIVRFDMGA